MLIQSELTKLYRQILNALIPYVEQPLSDYYALRDLLDERHPIKEITDVLMELEADGLVVFQLNTNGIFQIRLTHKGLSYRLLLRKAAWKKWSDRIWSFLIGVATGVVSTLIIQQVSLWIAGRK